VSTVLPGPFESELWTRLVPEAYVANKSTRHAVIAVAALSFTSKGHPRAEEYHQLLYGNIKALLQMRTATSNGSHDLRTALIASMVIICFEAYYGNQESALGQLEAGLALLQCWFKEKLVLANVVLTHCQHLAASKMSSFKSIPVLT
jgi:hypothetical protein